MRDQQALRKDAGAEPSVRGVAADFLELPGGIKCN
jgi:hypothetical protein